MTAQFRFNARSSDLPAIQSAVKQHGMRFVSNPAKWMSCEEQYVTVESDSGDGFAAGCAAIRDIVSPPAPPTPQRRPWWQFWRRS